MWSLGSVPGLDLRFGARALSLGSVPGLVPGLGSGLGPQGTGACFRPAALVVRASGGSEAGHELSVWGRYSLLSQSKSIWWPVLPTLPLGPVRLLGQVPFWRTVETLWEPTWRSDMGTDPCQPCRN